jgi:hypothetical protein
MKKIFVALFLLTFASLTVLPNTSLAYLPVEQTAVKLNDTTFLFTIKYRFNFLNYEVNMPMGAKRSLEYGAASTTLGYALLTEDSKPFTAGETYSIVLSDTKVVNNSYQTPNSKAGYFTLVTLLKLPEERAKSETETNLHLQVTTLPYTLIKEGVTLPSQLPESQLKEYKTPSIKF